MDKATAAIVRRTEEIPTKRNFVDILQFFFVACTVLEAYNRADADGKSQIKGVEQELPVQQNRDGSDTLFPGQPHHDNIEKESDDGIGKLGNHFRGTIITCLPKFFEMESETGEMQCPFGKNEKYKADNSRNRLSDTCSQSCTADAHMKHNNENIVQHGIENTGNHGQNQAKIRAACGDKIRLKQTLQHGSRGKTNDHGQVTVAVSQQNITGTQNSGNRSQIHLCQHKNHNTDEQTDDHKLGHAFFGLLLLALTHVAADNGVAAGAQH